MFSFITTYVCFALIVLQTLIIRCFHIISSGLPAAVEIFLQPLQQFVVLEIKRLQTKYEASLSRLLVSAARPRFTIVTNGQQLSAASLTCCFLLCTKNNSLQKRQRVCMVRCNIQINVTTH